jgi:hypothetical protein
MLIPVGEIELIVGRILDDFNSCVINISHMFGSTSCMESSSLRMGYFNTQADGNIVSA